MLYGAVTKVKQISVACVYSEKQPVALLAKDRMLG